jgi:putative lipase involved disintegration of autophagic bodies
MKLSTMNVLRKCCDCAQYRYEVYCDSIDGSYFCQQCHDERVREGEGVNHGE